MPYQKIFVALDRSAQSDFLFEKALEIAKKDGSSLMLFHALPYESEGITPYTNLYGQQLMAFTQSLQERIDEETESVRQFLTAYAEKAMAEGVPAETTWAIGEAGRRIRDLAKEWEADLIVVGRRGRQGLTEMVMGSVSNYVVHHVSCCVLVVQGINR
ncbi:MAG: universal stress protein [Chroococcales cyanobacterium]